MLRSEVPAPPQWRVILARVREQRRRVRERESKESEEVLLNGRECLHALDDMRHWRDPVRCRYLRRRRRTLINDNPSSG